MILITGASGQVGCTLLRALARKNIQTRAFVHSDTGKQKVIEAGASEVFVGDFTKKEELQAAFKDVDTVYYICSAANPEEDMIGANMIDIAKEMGGIYFVYHSVLHSVLQEMPHHQKKLHTEQLLVNSGLKYAIVQPAVFMQMLLPAIKSVQNGGPLYQKFFTSDTTRISMVDMEDFAEAAASILLDKAYMNGTFELCGSESYSLSGVEKIFSQAASRNIESAFISDDAFIRQSGTDPMSYQANTLLTMFKHYNENSFCGSSMVLKTILGHEPQTLYQFVKKHLLSEKV